MESLTQMTVNQKVAARLFTSPALLSRVLNLVQHSRMTPLKDDEDALTDMEKEHWAVMHRHALTVLANCLAALSEVQDRDQAVRRCADAATLSAIVSAVTQAAVQPHEAQQACRALVFLMKQPEASMLLKPYLSVRLPPDVLEATQKQCRHALFLSASTQLLQEWR
jgi:hypothetical protein